MFFYFYLIYASINPVNDPPFMGYHYDQNGPFGESNNVATFNSYNTTDNAYYNVLEYNNLYQNADNNFRYTNQPGNDFIPYMQPVSLYENEAYYNNPYDTKSTTQGNSHVFPSISCSFETHDSITSNQLNGLNFNRGGPINATETYSTYDSTAPNQSNGLSYNAAIPINATETHITYDTVYNTINNNDTNYTHHDPNEQMNTTIPHDIDMVANLTCLNENYVFNLTDISSTRNNHHTKTTQLTNTNVLPSIDTIKPTFFTNHYLKQNLSSVSIRTKKDKRAGRDRKLKRVKPYTTGKKSKLLINRFFIVPDVQQDNQKTNHLNSSSIAQNKLFDKSSNKSRVDKNNKKENQGYHKFTETNKMLIYLQLVALDSEMYKEISKELKITNKLHVKTKKFKNDLPCLLNTVCSETFVSKTNIDNIPFCISIKDFIGDNKKIDYVFYLIVKGENTIMTFMMPEFIFLRQYINQNIQQNINIPKNKLKLYANVILSLSNLIDAIRESDENCILNSRVNLKYQTDHKLSYFSRMLCNYFKNEIEHFRKSIVEIMILQNDFVLAAFYNLLIELTKGTHYIGFRGNFYLHESVSSLCFNCDKNKLKKFMLNNGFVENDDHSLQKGSLLHESKFLQSLIQNGTLFMSWYENCKLSFILNLGLNEEWFNVENHVLGRVLTYQKIALVISEKTLHDFEFKRIDIRKYYTYIYDKFLQFIYDYIINKNN